MLCLRKQQQQYIITGGASSLPRTNGHAFGGEHGLGLLTKPRPLKHLDKKDEDEEEEEEEEEKEGGGGEEGGEEEGEEEEGEEGEGDTCLTCSITLVNVMSTNDRACPREGAKGMSGNSQHTA